MNRSFSCAQNKLCKKLRKSRVNSLTVKELCQILSMSRNTFYRRYKGKAEFMAACITLFIRDELHDYEKYNFDQYFYGLLLHIYKERTFYSNIVNIIDNSYICPLLKKSLSELIKNRAQIRNPIFETLTNEFSSFIYSYIYHWVKHECNSEVHTIWGELKYIIEFLKFHSKEKSEVDYLSKIYLLNFWNTNIID